MGDLVVLPLNDGVFHPKPGYFGPAAQSRGHEALFRHDGRARLPIGCFLVSTDNRVVLVDAGLGPLHTGDVRGPDGERSTAVLQVVEQSPLTVPVHGAGDRYELVGGNLMTELRAVGLAPEDVTDIVLTHLHSDHVGWLGDQDGRPLFPRARVHAGAADWQDFVVEGNGFMFEHVRAAMGTIEARGTLSLMEGDRAICRGITAVSAPGHTFGHYCVVVSSQDSRALLLGDAITCPVQLDEAAWHSIGDLDPALAERTRELLWRELAGDDVVGVGAHFPELQFGRVLAGTGRRWWT